ncbi:MAG: nucleotidyltransferase domain-containing protein [Spirochaetaceae bacterium]|nr:nucleotidyltransferase domain-containing protein [Spirochaetaceae bacterium]
MKLATMIDRLQQALVEAGAVKIMLFGSTVSQDRNDESDIDLMVVVEENYIPQNYEERMRLRSRLRLAIREINREIAVDLLVYTRAEYDELRANPSSFFTDVHDHGRVIYDRAS